MPKVVNPTIEEGDDELGRFHAIRLSDAGGLTQFGAVLETLWPGGASAKNHWHTSEDEMVLILEGVATLVEGSDVQTLGPGEAATFKAGIATGHHLENRTEAPIRYLVIGTRSDNDMVTYSKTGETVTTRDGEKIYRDARGTITGRKPYQGDPNE